ncbi:MAG: DUF2207 domain-containing protein [Thermodesulfobacteriota bacterium]
MEKTGPYPSLFLSRPHIRGPVAFLLPAILLVCLYLAAAPFPAAAHLDDNLKGVPPSPASEWHYYGFTPEESKRWIASGIIFAAWAAQWRDEGFSPEAADQWHRLTNVYTAGDFLKNGLSAEEAKQWMDNGVKSGLRAGEYAAIGLTPEQGGSFWEKGIYPDDVSQWWQAGFDARSMMEWYYGPRESPFFFTSDSPYGRSLYKVEAAVAWRDAGFSARDMQMSGAFGLDLPEAVKWKQAGFSFDEAVRWRDSGFSLSEAFVNKDEGFPPAAAELRRYDASTDKPDEITDYVADITVNPDGTIDVLETISLIDRPGGAYENGFFRSLQKTTRLLSLSSYGFARNTWVAPSYRIRSVEADGQPLDFASSDDRLLIPTAGAAGDGPRQLRIEYRTDSRILFEPHHDELYFGIVEEAPEGLYIRRASATVRLPKGAEIIFTDGLAGLRQRRDLFHRVESTPSGDVARFSVTRPLRPGMTFAVSVGFVRGVVRESPRRQLIQINHRAGRFLSSLAIFLGGFAAAFIYYIIAWHRVGRDPRAGDTTMAEFSPPDNMDPATLRALRKRGKTDHVSVAAELLFLAEQGMIRITESQGIYKIEKTAAAPAALPHVAGEFYATIFNQGDTVYLMRRGKTRSVSGGAYTLKRLLKNRHTDSTRTNQRYLLPGLVISLATIAACLAVIDYDLIDDNDAWAALAIYVPFLTIAFGLMVFIFMRLLRSPTEAFVRVRERMENYVLFLRSDYDGRRISGFIPPAMRAHLPYAMAAGMTIDNLMIRNNEATWYHGSSGGFHCGDFIRILKKSV